MRLFLFLIFSLPLFLFNSCVNNSEIVNYDYTEIYDYSLSSSFEYTITFSKGNIKGHVKGFYANKDKYTIYSRYTIGGQTESMNAIFINGNLYIKKDKKGWEKSEFGSFYNLNDYFSWFIPEEASLIKKRSREQVFYSKIIVPLFMGINRDSLDDYVFVKSGRIRKVTVSGNNGLKVSIKFSYKNKKLNVEEKRKIKLIYKGQEKERDINILKDRLQSIFCSVDTVYSYGDTVFFYLKGKNCDSNILHQIFSKGNRGIYKVKWALRKEAGKLAYSEHKRLCDDGYSLKWKVVVYDSLSDINIEKFNIKSDNMGFFTLDVTIKKLTLPDSLRWAFCVDNTVYDSQNSKRIDSLTIRSKLNEDRLRYLIAILKNAPLSGEFSILEILNNGIEVYD